MRPLSTVKKSIFAFKSFCLLFIYHFDNLLSQFKERHGMNASKLPISLALNSSHTLPSIATKSWIRTVINATKRALQRAKFASRARYWERAAVHAQSLAQDAQLQLAAANNLHALANIRASIARTDARAV
jgi:hypothetical protein